MSNPSDEEIAQVIEFMRHQQEHDPLALLQPMRNGKTQQLLQMRAVNLEIALFIAQITGAVIVTDISALWRQLHVHTRASESEDNSSNNFKSVCFTAPLDIDMAIRASEFTEAKAARSAIDDLKAIIDRRSGRKEVERALHALQAQFSAFSTPIEAMGVELPQAKLSLLPSIPESGFESTTAQRLVVSFGNEDVPVHIGLAFFRQTEREDDEHLK